MAIDTETNHANEAVDLLVSQFRDSEKIRAIIAALVGPLQTTEDDLQALLTDRAVSVAEGVQLDGDGDIVGQPRGGRIDDAYRVAIRSRIQLNLSSGTVEQLYGILMPILGDGYTSQIVELFPKDLMFIVSGALETATATYLAEVLELARSAAVGAAFIYSEVEDADTFFFASGDVAESSSTQGLANDAQTTGGKFADVIEA